MSRASHSTTKRKLSRLGRVLRGHADVWILLHDGPDPDAMAGGMALRVLLHEKYDVRAQIVHGGFIGRPDNRAMAESLDIPLQHVGSGGLPPADSFICVDTQPAFSNNSLPPGAEVLGVIDHHPLETEAEVPFVDIRPGFGAVSSLLAEYLLVAGVEIPGPLATAIAYAILSETEDLGRAVSSDDLDVYMRVLPKVDHVLLGRLRNPRLERPFFRTLVAGLKAATLWGEVVFCHLARLNAADDLPRIADTLNRYDGARWVLCTGRHSDRLLLCLRTSDVSANAERVMDMVMADREGGSGGHGMVAGGQVELDDGQDMEELRGDLTRALLAALGYEEDHPHEPLVPDPENLIPEEQR